MKYQIEITKHWLNVNETTTVSFFRSNLNTAKFTFLQEKAIAKKLVEIHAVSVVMELKNKAGNIIDMYIS